MFEMQERNANLKQFTSQNGLCLHGAVLYVCMYLIFLYEVCVFFSFLLRCSGFSLLFQCILCNTMCCKRTQRVISVPKQKPEDISCVK